MDAAKKRSDTALEQLETEFTDLDTLLAATPIDKDAVELQLQLVDGELQNFYKIQDKYIDMLIAGSADLEYKTEQSVRFRLRKRRVAVGSAITKGLQPTAPAGGATSSTATAGGRHFVDPTAYRVYLPKREMPKFSGDVRQWRSFWASFQEVDADSSIPEIEKYNFLFQSMTVGSSAAKVVSSFPASDTSYKLARDELKHRFGQTKTLIKVYIRDLLTLVVENAKEKKNCNFIDVVTSIQSQILNLEQLGVTQDKFGLLLYPIIESCIPVDVLRRYLDMPGVKEDLVDIMDFLRNEVRRKEETARAQAAFGVNEKEERTQKGSVQKQDKAHVPTAATFINATEKISCGFCSKNHKTTECRKAASMSMDEKKACLKRTGTCFRCLKGGHHSRNCTSNVACPFCKRNHHVLMCFGREAEVRVDQLNINPAVARVDQRTYMAPQLEQQPQHFQDNYYQQPNWTYEASPPVAPVPRPRRQPQTPLPRTGMANYIRKPEVLMQTLLVRVYSPTGFFKTVRAMIDTASQSSYIKESLAKEMRQQSLGKELVIHQYFGAILSKEMEHDVTRICVSGVAQPYLHQFTFEASIVANMAKDIITVPNGPWIKECADMGVQLTDVGDVPNDVEIFIGNDMSPYLKVGMRSYLLQSGIVATETRLGWFLEGRVPGSIRKDTNKAMVCVNMQVTDKEVESLWALETIGIRDAAENRTRVELEEAAMNHFMQTVKRDESGRYEVHLPWIEGHPSLPENKFQMLRRLDKTTKDLIRDGYLEQYHAVFQDWERMGIIERVPNDKPPAGVVHYLGHRAVYKEGSTTPVRPVFNASGKTKLGPSLNDCLEKGPNLLDQIPSNLSRFRMNAIGVISDICKAFLQLLVTEKHRDSLRFSWWEDIDGRKTVVEYRHCRVVFGVSSSPFLLLAVIKHLLDLNEEMYPETVSILRTGFYVDNCAASLPTLEEVIKFKTESEEIFSSAKMDLRGWEYGPSSEEKIVPVLGLLWNTGKDTLSYDVQKMLQRTYTGATKRNVLQLANSLYDPLGLLCPVVIVIKMIFKRVCSDERKFGWDTELPENFKIEVDKWRSQLGSIASLTIPRFIGHCIFGKENWSLHVMCDASKDAYSCCVYLRIEANPVKVQLVQARARVTPMTILTIPRAELLGCLIAARLYSTVKEDIGAAEVPVTFWCDSTTALSWIKRTDAVWGVFVNRRVEEIRKLTNVDDWRHIPGEMNPADLPSRGTTFQKYSGLRWWEGPDWLYREISTFPNTMPEADQELVLKEKKKSVVSAFCKMEDTYFQQQLLRIGDWHKILRVVVNMLLFVSRVRKLQYSTGELYRRAEIALLRYIQRSFSIQPIPQHFRTFKDENGIIRMKTRIVDEAECHTNPILLPACHHLVRLLIMKEHSLASHAGIQYMMSILREKYWIVNSRRSIKSVINGCSICRVYAARRCKVEEAPLPLNRVKTTRCFAVTGVDLAGPLVLKTGEKVWIVLFTCAVYRAVHVELVTSLSTEAFLIALRKFVTRRGRPKTIYSDNGTNFRGCSNMFKRINWKEVEQYAGVSRINWIFNPPTAAWWGGFWERLVGLMKQLLRRVLGSRSVNYNELEVLVLEVEAVLNERPLTYISEDTADLRPLTPSLFLRDLEVACLPEADLLEAKLRGNLRQVHSLRDQLRSRFRREYLAQLVHNGKQGKSDLLSIGDVVLVEVENRKRIEWPIGVITEVYPGRDGVNRTVRVRTNNGEMLRPFQRLFPLEIRSGSIGNKRILTENKLPEINEKENDEEDCLIPEELLNDDPEPILITRFGRRVKKPNRLGLDNLV